MRTGEFEPGDRVTVGSGGDLYFDAASRPFIGAECQIIKRTRGGKILVMLCSDENKTYAVRQSNLIKI